MEYQETSVKDHRQAAILYVDDEEKSLKNFERAFGHQFRIFTAPNAVEGLRLLREHRDEVGILMTDQRMPGEKGVWLLEQARQMEPRILRILVTAYADMETAIEAVNSGAIYKYLTKPWDPPQLEMMLRRALEFYSVQCERDQLLTEKMAMLRNMLVADRVLSLGLLAAGMSHHIRNALVAVRTFIELAPAKLKEENLSFDRLQNPDFWTQYCENALAQVDKINNMLRDLWAAAERPDSEFLDRVHLQQIVPSIASRYRQRLDEHQMRLEIEIAEDLPPMRADAKKIARLFELLLEDELGFLPDGCRLRIAAQLERGSEDDREVRIEFQDDGPGLPEDSLRTIFDPFAVRNDSPSEYGIRLMACFFIVHYHRGKIVAQSAEGKGTTFTLRIPLDPARRPEMAESRMFLQRVHLNDEVWGQLLSSG